MNLREATAVNTLLHWLLGDQVDATAPVPHHDQAAAAAEVLAAAAYSKLAAGIVPDDVRNATWPEYP